MCPSCPSPQSPPARLSLTAGVFGRACGDTQAGPSAVFRMSVGSPQTLPTLSRRMGSAAQRRSLQSNRTKATVLPSFRGPRRPARPLLCPRLARAATSRSPAMAVSVLAAQRVLSALQLPRQCFESFQRRQCGAAPPPPPPAEELIRAALSLRRPAAQWCPDSAGHFMTLKACS